MKKPCKRKNARSKNASGIVRVGTTAQTGVEKDRNKKSTEAHTKRIRICGFCCAVDRFCVVN